MDECPVCLEPLTGTIVQMGCCKNKVHIQCYVTKCPLCRAALPPPRSTEPNQIIIPIATQPTTQPHKAITILKIGGVLVAVGLYMYFC